MEVIVLLRVVFKSEFIKECKLKKWRVGLKEVYNKFFCVEKWFVIGGECEDRVCLFI